MTFAVQARGLEKRYRIGQYAGAYDTLREEIVRLTRRVVRLDPPVEPQREIWALRGVDFDVEEGEILGIVGRNGAGKTTLLRVLSRITEPTGGYADVRGRVGSLLEVGTGFHPELTGRENVFLNGAILGMRRSEIVRKFDEIVDFSGVEKFIDTPVKRYSTGMYVRLAFSVAAHLEPDILVVDEVLAVGDAEFQRKCIGKMESVGGEGRTVLFVSHNMPAMGRLCSRAIMLDRGRVVAEGATTEVVARYLSEAVETPMERVWSEDEAPGDAHARLRQVRVVDAGAEPAAGIRTGESLGVEVTFDVLQEDVPLVPMLSLFTGDGTLLFNALDPDPRWREPRRGTYTTCAWIPADLLSEGEYSATIFVNTPRPGRADRHVYVPHAVSFLVSGVVPETTSYGHPTSWGGIVVPRLSWAHGRAAVGPSSARR